MWPLVWLGRRRSIRAPGLFALYVAGYSFARIGEELLRVDPAHRLLGLRLNLYVASLLCVAGLVWFVHIQRGAGRSDSAAEARDAVGERQAEDVRPHQSHQTPQLAGSRPANSIDASAPAPRSPG